MRAQPRTATCVGAEQRRLELLERVATERSNASAAGAQYEPGRHDRGGDLLTLVGRLRSLAAARLTLRPPSRANGARELARL